eukprot:evm.model.NODE_17322_length_11106_cov_35.773457.3
MEPEAKALFLEASFKHALATRCCSKGTELLFTWSAEDVLEVRLNGRLVEAFSNHALAQELFANYVNDDPISPQANDKHSQCSTMVKSKNRNFGVYYLL